MADDQPTRTKGKQGFASMSPEKRREIAIIGGKSVPAEKLGFAALSPERRRELASKGGKSVPAEKRSFSTNPDLAAQAGRKGGQAVRRSRQRSVVSRRTVTSGRRPA
jgi:uncharacterized protein